jgi:hypothetical protein
MSSRQRFLLLRLRLTSLHGSALPGPMLEAMFRMSEAQESAIAHVAIVIESAYRVINLISYAAFA